MHSTKQRKDTDPRCRPIRLTERVKDHGQLVLRDTDTSVGHAELQRDVPVVFSEQPAAERDMALAGDLRRRELDSVAHQVRNDLT